MKKTKKKLVLGIFAVASFVGVLFLAFNRKNMQLTLQ